MHLRYTVAAATLNMDPRTQHVSAIKAGVVIAVKECRTAAAACSNGGTRPQTWLRRRAINFCWPDGVGTRNVLGIPLRVHDPEHSLLTEGESILLGRS